MEWPTKNSLFTFTSVLLLLQHQSASAGSMPGYVVGWGMNNSGEATGRPTMGFSFVATNSDQAVAAYAPVIGLVTIENRLLTNAVAVSAGGWRVLALRNDGTVAGWGGNLSGQAIGETTPYPGRTNGVVRLSGQVLTNLIAVAAGRTHSLALRGDGSVVAWGENNLGQTDVPVDLTNVIAISAGWSHSLALKRDGTLTWWGSTPKNEAEPPEGLSNVVAVSIGGGGDSQSLALKRDGTIVRWGFDSHVPPGLSNIISVAAGWNHCLALAADGNVFGWGINSHGQATGDTTSNPSHKSEGLVVIDGRALTNVVAIAAGDEYSLALKRDGTVVAWGNKQKYSEVPIGLSNVVAIAAGQGFCLAITTNKEVAERFHK